MSGAGRVWSNIVVNWILFSFVFFSRFLRLAMMVVD